MRHLTYSWADRDEQLLTCGPDGAEQRILFVPPLFDEMNRVRRTLVEAMRILGDTGISSTLPDLPGCNESQAKLEDQSLEDWRDAITAAAKAIDATQTFSVRGGALIDDGPALPTIRLSPAKGKSLLNMLVRTRIVGDKEAGVTTTAEALRTEAENGSVELAGHNISALMWNGLETAEIPDGSDAALLKPADVDGSALWLRAEPQHDPAMAAGLAEMLAKGSAAS